MSSDKTSAEHPPSPLIPNTPVSLTADIEVAPWRRRLQMMLVVLLVIGYAALSHYSTESPTAKGLGAALSIAPVLLILLVVSWRWNGPWTAVAVGALAAALLYRYWPIIEQNYAWADLVQQCGAYGLISLSFSRSLLGGHVPLCTQLAEKVHGELSPAEIDYTRRATAAWAIFYVLIAALILVLFLAAPLHVWSLFVNFAIFGLIMFMGIVDHAVRRHMLPRHPSGGMLDIIRRAFFG